MNKKFKLTKKEGNQFYFQEHEGTICFSFLVSYLIDGTCVMSGDLGCLTWKRECFPKKLDYGFPNKETGISYFAEKVSQHNIPQSITNEVTGGYSDMFKLLFECLQSVSDDILKAIKPLLKTKNGRTKSI